MEIVVYFVPPLNRFVTYRDANVLSKYQGAYKKYIYKGMNVGIISEFRVKIKHNSFGFHDKEYPVNKRKGLFRILIIGDSQVEAIQVHLEQTFHNILEQKFTNDSKNVEVSALGKSGIGLAEAYELYINIGHKFKPDLVIWGFTPINNIYDSLPKLKIKLLLEIKSISGDLRIFLDFRQ